MGLNTSERQEVTYFTGVEVEHTIAHGLYTLFVVGTPPSEEILYKAMRHKVKQIYFGTSQSFQPKTEEDWQAWDAVIDACLKASGNYFVTLDFGVEYAEQVLDSGWDEHQNFISMISVKLPYISLFNYNATLKLDDVTWGHSNPGVWTHQLHDLKDKEKYTHWKQYTNDTVITSDEAVDDKFLELA